MANNATNETKTENALQQQRATTDTAASTGATTTERKPVKAEDMKLFVVRDSTGREVVAVLSTNSIKAHRNRTDNTIELLDGDDVVNTATLMAGNYSEPYTFDVYNDVNANRLTTEPDSSDELDVKDEDEEQDLEKLNEQRRQDAVRRGLPPETAGPVTTATSADTATHDEKVKKDNESK